MSPQPSRTILSSVAGNKGPERHPLDLGRLNFLGRMPIPLRRPFKTGLDRTVAAHQAATGVRLDCCFLSGSEWYRPFDELAAAKTSADLPDMLVTTLHHDILDPGLLACYTPPDGEAPPIVAHPACVDGDLLDPLGVFQTFAVIPFVFLVDHQRLKGRAAPRCWSDLLDPIWAEDIVFGGWRLHGRVPYQDYNSYLLFSLYQEYGRIGLEAFAANVRNIQHNIRTATQAGSNSRNVGAIAVLPWLQAELCPRRGRTQVIWPEDGALALPIGFLIKPDARARLTPLVNYVCGSELGIVLARNCYPPVNAAVTDAFPRAGRLKWAGWNYIRNHDMAAEESRASQLFFSAWNQTQEHSVCS
jgi:ABC-type Fe3+ transport system substrate-binding protein